MDKSVTNVDLVCPARPNFSLPLIKFKVGIVLNFAHTLCLLSRNTDEAVRERSQQVMWSSQLLQLQLMLYSHILQLENSDPLRMATFNDLVTVTACFLLCMALRATPGKWLIA